MQAPPLIRRNTFCALDETLWELDQFGGLGTEPARGTLRAPEPASDGPGADDHLLSLLGRLAAGVRGEDDDGPGDDSSADDGDALASGLFEFLPPEVQSDDPTVHTLLVDCGRAWDELQRAVAWKREIRRYSLRDLIRAQEESQLKLEQSETLRQQLQETREASSEQLHRDRQAESDLRQDIELVRYQVENLKESGQRAVAKLEGHEASLDTSIAETGGAQAALMAELQEASDRQFELQTELNRSRAALAADRKRLACIQDERASQRAFAESLLDGEDGGSGLSSQRRAGAWKIEADDDDVEQQAFRLRLRVADQRASLQAVREQLRAGEVDVEALGAQAEELQGLARGGRLGQLPREALDSVWVEGMGFDVTGEIRAVEALRRALAERQSVLLSSAEVEADLLALLEGRLEDLSDLQVQLLQEEAASEAGIGQAASASEVLFARVCVQSARGLRRADIGGKSDPYVMVGIAGMDESDFHKTSYKTRTLDPEWNEPLDLLDFSLGQEIEFVVMDHDSLTQDDYLGSARLESSLLASRRFEGQLALYDDGRHGRPGGKISGFITVSVDIVGRPVQNTEPERPGEESCARLRREVADMRAALREEETSSERRRQTYRAQVDAQRAELSTQRGITRQLQAQLRSGAKPAARSSPTSSASPHGSGSRPPRGPGHQQYGREQ